MSSNSSNMPFADLEIHKKQIFSQKRYAINLDNSNDLAFSKDDFEMPSVVNDRYICGI